MNIAWISKIELTMPHKTSRLKMTEALIRRGNYVNLYMAKSFGEKSKLKKNQNYIKMIPTINLPILSGLFYGILVFFYFPILLKKHNYDIIIIDCTKVWLPFVIPLKILNKPIILDVRTLPIDRDESLPFRIVMYLSNYVIDGITTITPELKKILISEYGVKKKIGIWSSGVSIEDFNMSGKLKPNKPNHRFTLIYHGAYSRTRGIENLIKSIGILKKPLKNNIELIIIGIPKDKIGSLTNLAEEEKVGEIVKILPKIRYNQILNYLSKSDIGLIPLPPDNKWWKVSAPLKTLEYLAAEIPIIATKIPFHERIFAKENCGILLNTGDPKELSEAIQKLYKNRKHLKKMGRNGKNIIKKYYTWDFMAKKNEEFLKKFMN